MEERRFLAIETIDRELLESVQRQNGRLPDNFVDSAEGAYPDIPAGELLEQVDAAAAGLLERTKTEGDGPPSVERRSETDG
jgi:hypothetical protein